MRRLAVRVCQNIRHLKAKWRQQPPAPPRWRNHLLQNTITLMRLEPRQFRKSRNYSSRSRRWTAPISNLDQAKDLIWDTGVLLCGWAATLIKQRRRKS